MFEVDSVENKDWVNIRVSSSIMYITHNASTKIVICFLLAYCVFVVIHFFYADIIGISSTC